MELEEEAVIGTWRKVYEERYIEDQYEVLKAFWWREKVLSWVVLALAHELFVILIFFSDWETEREIRRLRD